MIRRLIDAALIVVEVAVCLAHALADALFGPPCVVCKDRFRDMLGHCYLSHGQDDQFQRRRLAGEVSPTPFTDKETQ